MKTILCCLFLMSTSLTMVSQDTSLDLSVPLAKIQKAFKSLEGKLWDRKVVSYTIDANTITKLYKSDYGDGLKIIQHSNIQWYRMTSIDLKDDEEVPVFFLNFNKRINYEIGDQGSKTNETRRDDYIVVNIPTKNKDKLKADFYELRQVSQNIARIGGDGWNSYEKDNDLETAISKSLIALKHDPSLKWVRANLGLFYWIKGDTSLSKTYYKETIRQMVLTVDDETVEAMIEDIAAAREKYPNLNFEPLEAFLASEFEKYI